MIFSVWHWHSSNPLSGERALHSTSVILWRIFLWSGSGDTWRLVFSCAGSWCQCWPIGWNTYTVAFYVCGLTSCTAIQVRLQEILSQESKIDAHDTFKFWFSGHLSCVRYHRLHVFLAEAQTLWHSNELSFYTTALDCSVPRNWAKFPVRT